MGSAGKSKGPLSGKLRWVLVALAAYAPFGLWNLGPKSKNIPDELVGVWRTSDPRYGDRSFEIDSVIINFGTGEGGSTTGFIQKVEAVREGSRTRYTIFYNQDGQENQCSFYYGGDNGNTIVFRNQPGIPWVKVGEL